MKLLFTAAALAGTVQLFAQSTHAVTAPASPLSVYSAEWNNPVYAKCNTAANAIYMTKNERDVIYILNLLHANPSLFAKTVVPHFSYADNPNYKSLVDTLLKIDARPMLYPDKKCYNSALCHATSSGKVGYVGHVRQSTSCEAKKYYNAECASYGSGKAIEIVMQLLIDDGVPSLGHRYACIASWYKLLGVSIQPHIGYGNNAVLDFKY
jgi:hypothetical protein